jgi:hypothetical protein
MTNGNVKGTRPAPSFGDSGSVTGWICQLGVRLQAHPGTGTTPIGPVSYVNSAETTATQLISTNASGRISSVTPTAVHAG